MDVKNKNKKISANLNYLKISPRKVRMVANTIKGLSVNEAEAQLLFQKRRSAKPILKLLRSAAANAVNNFHLNKEKLGIVKIEVNLGPRFKRYMPRARGVMSLIEKKSSHISIVLEELDKFISRFKILPPKTKKSKIKAVKKSPEKKPTAEKEKKESFQQAAKKSGFFKRIFRRKAI